MLQRLSEMATLALTNRRQSAEQQRLKEADLRERLRLSARRLVHEARNPLSVMKTHLELLGERARSGEPIDNDIRVMREEIDRVGEIVGRIGTTDLGGSTGTGGHQRPDPRADDRVPRAAVRGAAGTSSWS
jgi:nitrogen-specific signal transduction histidine kinase